jgi:branched-chain amino acid transport system permease protein
MKEGIRNILVGLIFLAVALVLPVFFKDSRYTLNILNLTGIFVVFTYSLNFIHGYLGLISIGQAGFFAIGAYVTAGLSMAVGLNYFFSLFLAAIASSVAGALIGFPATRIRGHYFVLITLGFGEIVRLIILNWNEVTNGTNGVNNIPPPRLGPWAFDSRLSYYYLVLFFVVLTLLVTLSLRRSKYGRSMLALKVSEQAATLMGVNPTVNKLISFCLSSFFAGLAGGLYASYIGSISPEPFGVNLSVDVLTMLLVGGSGTVAGPVVGAVFLVVLKEWLRFMKEYYMIVYGAGIVLVMIFMPEGIAGLVRNLMVRLHPGASETGGYTGRSSRC